LSGVGQEVLLVRQQQQRRRKRRTRMKQRFVERWREQSGLKR